ncbi:hypothetical protein N657DRAFT_643049 [Parathielavia appendiculata]|uniref:Uncharacterized protein n=1 Tax=Parathielavia appendiculata TaxID=2587402 RepID=A0AAN6Z6D7_9PEZI|nr:hypothetical protein N657DRAFT_643049 [Parathielavia appendiculata]
MSTLPEPEQPLMCLDEYITLCADLHNTLIDKSIPPDSQPLEISTDLLQRYESYRANPPFDPYAGVPDPPALDCLSSIAILLSQLRTTITPSKGQHIPLTPLLYQPMPEWFFPPLYSYDIEAADSPFLLLYPQRLPSEPCIDGGLFVHIYTLDGIWLQAPPGPAMPPPQK